MEKFFTKKDFADAETVLAQLSVKTNCFNKQGKVIPAEYLVCVDDDISSAFYAADLYYQIAQTYEVFPTILCVGGKGPLSKYTNAKGETEGKKLARVCESLGVLPSRIQVLDKGTNTGLNCLDIYYEVANTDKYVIMCLTKRLSLRFKQTFEYLNHQYPDKVDKFLLEDIIDSTFYFVPEETVEGMMEIYNCKGLCKGALLLSEIASIYDRTYRYSGSLQKPLDFDITRETAQAALRLAKKYPLKINMFSFNGIWQFIWAYFSVVRNKKKIREEIDRTIKDWRDELQDKYSL